MFNDLSSYDNYDCVIEEGYLVSEVFVFVNVCFWDNVWLLYLWDDFVN